MICSILLLFVSLINVLWNCSSMLTQNKYDLHSYNFHFSTLTLLACFFCQNTTKALQACKQRFASENSSLKNCKTTNGLHASGNRCKQMSFFIYVRITNVSTQLAGRLSCLPICKKSKSITWRQHKIIVSLALVLPNYQHTHIHTPGSYTGATIHCFTVPNKTLQWMAPTATYPAIIFWNMLLIAVFFMCTVQHKNRSALTFTVSVNFDFVFLLHHLP